MSCWCCFKPARQICVASKFHPDEGEDLWFDAREELHFSDDEAVEDPTDSSYDITADNIGIEQGTEFPFVLGKVWEQEEHQGHVQRAIKEMKSKVRYLLRREHDAAVKQAEEEAAELERLGLMTPEKRELHERMRAGSNPDEFAAATKGLKVGQDLTDIELPPTFFVPFSTIQVAEDVVYVIEGLKNDWSDLQHPDPARRMARLIKLYLDMSAIRTENGSGAGVHSPYTFGAMKKPLNPILGETHRIKCGKTAYLAEQVCHHPPITTWDLRNEEIGLHLSADVKAKPVFRGTAVQVLIDGEMRFENLHTKEKYVMDFPSLFIRFFGLAGRYSETVGTVTLRRVSEGPLLHAELHFRPRGTAGLPSRAHRFDGSVVSEKGSCIHFRGKYSDGVDEISEAGEVSQPFWRPAEPNSSMPPRAVTQPLNGFTDSHCLWGEFFQALIVRDMKTASKAKKKAERGQRRLHKAMKTGELPPWSPTMFATEDGERWTLKDKFDPRVQQSWLRYIGYRIFE
jgi:hypothetical protein